MKAIVMREFGGPEVLKLEDVPDPVAAPDEIVIQVHAVSINRSFDLLVRRDGNNRNPMMPLVFGADPSGIVTQVGDGVTDFKPGDRVSVESSIKCGTCKQCLSGDMASCKNTRQIGVHRWGGYAELAAIPARNAHRIPDALPFPDATVITRHGPAAFNELDDKAGVQPGDWVLVMGAAGALGSLCLQIAKMRGAKVIAAAGADERVRVGMELGADHGVNYRTRDLAAEVRKLTDGEGVDIVCENIGDPTLWDGAFDSMAQNGRLVTMGAHGGGKVELNLRQLYSRRLRIIGAAGSTPKNLEDALQAAAEGKIKALIDSVVPLSRAAEAHRRLETETTSGKVILDPTRLD